MHNNFVERNVNPATYTPDHDLSQGSIRLWDFFANWKQVETSAGVYDWTRLDQVVGIYEARGLPMIYTLGMTPDFHTTGQTTDEYDYGPGVPTDPQSFEDFCVAVATRYAGRIEAYQFWNEPSSASFWGGTVQQLVDLIEPAIAAVKLADPAALILTPGFAAGDAGQLSDYFEDFIAVADLSLYDVVCYHAYPDPAASKQVGRYIQFFKDIMVANAITKPLWITELGQAIYTRGGVTYDNIALAPSGPFLTMPDAISTAYVVRHLLWCLDKGVARAFWYTLSGQVMILQLIDRDVPETISEAGYSYKRFADMIARHAPAVELDTDLYSMAFVTQGGLKGAVYWREDETSSEVDLSLFRSGIDVYGDPITLSSTYSLTDSPVFCFR